MGRGCRRTHRQGAFAHLEIPLALAHPGSSIPSHISRAVIVKEAGGDVTDVWGDAYTLTTRNFVASNGYIHQELLGRLRAAEMWFKEEDMKKP